MTPAVQELLERLIESGGSIEEVCAEHPDLIDEVQERWLRLQAVRADIDILFPQHDRFVVGESPDDVAAPSPDIDGYELQGVVGRGGMGIVYRARQVALQRPVAIKVLHDDFVGPIALARFRREAELAAQLQHPNIVQVHHVGGDSGRPYIAMELLEGGSLAQRLHRTPMPARAAAEMMSILAAATDAAHRAGILHRDLKPSNVLMTADGHPKIADFGLARRIVDDAGLTQSGAKVGTPSYMSPEQARGDRAIGVATDVYSLGAVLYEMLTGRPPFRADTATATVRQILDEEPARPSRLNARVPRDLETICMHCLQKESRRRYATAADLAADLARFLSDEPIAARPTSAFERGLRWVRRNPSRATAVVLGLTLALLLSGGWLWLTARGVAVTSAIESDLLAVQRLERDGDWAAAEATLHRVHLSFPDELSARLATRVDRADRDLALVRLLEFIALDRANDGNTDFGRARTDQAYAKAFGQAGLGTVGKEPAVFGDAVAASDIRRSLISALDSWSFGVGDRSLCEWLLAAARRADPDPWRDQVRSFATWFDVTKVEELVRTCDAAAEPVELQLILGGLLEMNHHDPLAFYRRLQFANPTNFWANMVLGQCLDERHDPEAMTFYRVATALHPESAAPCVNLAILLDGQDRLDEAMDYWQRAVQLAPRSVMVHQNFASSCLNREDARAAEVQCRLAIECSPPGKAPTLARANLINALRRQGKTAAALQLIDELLSQVQVDDPYRQLVDEQIQLCREQKACSDRIELVLRGDAESRDAHEELEMATLLLLRNQYLDAARFFLAAFTHEPGLMEDRQPPSRYNAACAAARVGWGTAGEIPEPVREAWRGKARGWLDAEVAAQEQFLEHSDDAKLKGQIVRKMRNWKLDPDLGVLRDLAALQQMPAEDRSFFERFWQRVEAVGKRAMQEK
jgi:eukaryotic-like serine/threonine-protein kinase